MTPAQTIVAAATADILTAFDVMARLAGPVLDADTMRDLRRSVETNLVVIEQQLLPYEPRTLPVMTLADVVANAHARAAPKPALAVIAGGRS